MNTRNLGKRLAIGGWLAVALTAMGDTVIIDPGVGVATNVEDKITGTTDVSIRSGLVTLNPANDYTGTTAITGGQVNVSVLANAGTASSLGQSGTVNFGKGILKYTGTAAASTGRSFSYDTSLTSSGPFFLQTIDTDQDITFTSQYLAGPYGFVKLGSGKVIFTQKTLFLLTSASKSFTTGFTLGGNSYMRQFVMPTDGSTPTNGVGPFAILDGKVEIQQYFYMYAAPTENDCFFPVGGWTASQGETENDVELIVNSPTYTVTFASKPVLGLLHGFKDFNTPNGPAKAYFNIKLGRFQQGGGKAFYMGSTVAAPSGKTFNTDVRINVESAGKWDHSNSGAGLYLYQNKGQTFQINVDGGKFIETEFYSGRNAAKNDSSATVDINLTNGAQWMGEQFNANIDKVSGSAPMTVKVSGGSKFLVDQLSKGSGGTLNIEFDNATLGNMNFVWYLLQSGTKIGLKRRSILTTTVDSATIGKGGLTLYCQDNGGYIRGSDYTRVLGQEIVIAKALTPATSLAEGEKDGGLTITAQYPTNLIVLAGANTYAGPTVLQSGTFTLEGDGIVPAASEFTAQAGATLYVGTKDITLGKAKFETGSIIKVTKGKKLIITGTVDFEDGVILKFVDENGAELSAAETGLEFIQVPENQKEKLNALKVRGIYNSALYFSNGAVTTAEGASKLAVDLATRTDTASPTETTATWTGSGADDALTTGDNWEGGAAPAFDGGCLATFSETDGRAVVSSEKAFRGIQLGDNSFTFAKENDYAFILLKAAGLQFADLTEARTLKFSVPVESEVAQTWTLPANATVEFADRVRFNGTVKATDYSGGNIAFTGGRVEAGNMRLAATNMTVFFSGDINNLDGTVSTDYGLNDAGTIVLQSLKPADGTTVGSRNVFSNAVIRKAIYVPNGIAGKYYDFLESLPNTTNIFKGYLYSGNPYRYLKLGAGSTTIIDGTMNFGWSIGTHGTGTLIFRGPLKQGGGRFLAESAATVRFETTGNTWNDRMNAKADGCRFEYAVDDTFAGVSASSYLDLAETDCYCTNDIYGTTQHFPNIYTKSQKPVITGTYGSKIVITKGVTAGAAVYGVTNICCRVEDGVSLEVDAAGDLVLASREFASCGDLIATKGALRLENGAKWLNGTNFVVNANGTLKFTAAGQVEPRQAVLHLVKGGKVSVPTDITETFRSVYVTDGETTTELSAGTYDGTTGALKDYITGGGQIRVSKGTTLIIF